jgi:2,4-dienoyl-CoA reductase-like NADH-dependent reductase (Old Yellow Enzyme family)
LSVLFSPYTLRSVEFRNRIFVAPMCQYSAREGMPDEWHLVHLGSRAVGGAGLVMAEATAVSPEGRISPEDTGIWSAQHAEAFVPITTFIRRHGAAPAIQLAHAGRKASTAPPWQGGKVVAPPRGWDVVAPSPIPFDQGYARPRELTPAEIDSLVRKFAEAAGRADDAGFDVVEIHAAHGYLLHEFLSPLTNVRQDEYGGDLEGRMRFPLRVVEAVRQAWPGRKPLFVRISATDWVGGGWDLEQSIEFSRRLKSVGVDLVDCSSGGAVATAKVPAAPGYQVPFAAAIRREAGIATGAVGLITGAGQAEAIVANGEADVVLMARQMLRDPYFPLHAAKELGVDVEWPVQYLRAK